MTDLELVLTMLAEASTTDISKTAKPQGLTENQEVARQGGEVAGIAREALEARTGRPVITSQNANDFRKLVTDIVEDAAALPDQNKKNKIHSFQGQNKIESYFGLERGWYDLMRRAMLSLSG